MHLKLLLRELGINHEKLTIEEDNTACISQVKGGLEGAVKIDVEPAGRARMICVVLKSNIDKYQCNETQLLTEAIFD